MCHVFRFAFYECRHVALWSCYSRALSAETTMASTSGNTGTPSDLTRHRGRMTPERKAFLSEVRASLDRYGVEDTGHRHLHKAVDMKGSINNCSGTPCEGKQAKWHPFGFAEERRRQGDVVTSHVHDLTDEGRQHPAFSQLHSVPGDINIDLGVFVLRIE
ncbi:hypothetical protein Bbelb_316740 [Branchiostoma belcheri]|nr:hypothetical protein Bbelb_316740 [Branchiostoma belcheri]